ncbi:MAG: hypothetical protein M3352_07690 [Bacteroidota bacterium]|nr:hypothetical protein [Bacteroidota bacterium]
MKNLLPSLISVLFVFFLFSCQKEKSFESAAQGRGSLQADGMGDCLPKTVVGTYISNIALNDSNYIEAELYISSPGSYTISTDTINGYFFNASGTFSSIGTNRVKLKAIGKPITSGTDDFLIRYDTSVCAIQITVLPNGSGGAATFTLQGAGAACMNAVVGGGFVKNQALTAASKVDVHVNVSTIGSYTVSTNTVNGFSFSGTGNFAATGLQTISLRANGTPLNEGPTRFTVTAGANTCTFSANVTATGTPPPVSSNDHFPLTVNSWWSYDDPNTIGDTVKRLNKGPGTLNGNIYQEFVETDEAGDSESYHYRKAGNDYFEYTFVDAYSIVTFATPIEGDILFLKENLTTGDTWTSAEWSGTENGVAKKLRYGFTCTDAAASFTVGGKSFTNVYKITFKPQVSTSGGAFTNEAVEWTVYYAKGIGLIYLKGSVPGFGDYIIPIRNWQVF